MSKAALRSELVAARAALGAAERAARSAAIAARLLAHPPFLSARAVAAYAALGAEVDPAAAALAARARGATVVYPRARRDERVLAFAAAEPEGLVRGPLGALEPPAAAPAVAPEAIEVILLPGVAFTADGHRLGRGGGYYDATLAALPRALRIGLAFDLQIVPALPAEPHDARVDVVVTETRVLIAAIRG